ncbi:MAG TPA: NAD(P)-dependent oxidoreductase [Acidimicrobiia bacterium]|nr:NAD(P)-dependent oxidoreductase [Acidimicrobiia bacterium]
MKVLFTGATGVLGRPAVPLLLSAGHEVAAVARNDNDRKWLQGLGARPVECDLFDPDSVDTTVAGAEAVVHFATAIPSQQQMTKREAWAANDRLRSDATRVLVDASLTRGVGRFVQQSITLPYADGGEDWLDEDSPTDPGWEVLDSALEAERQLERFRRGGGTGVTLRLSRVYGPGRASGEYIAGIQARKIPVIGKGETYVSSIHVDDAATALAAAMTASNGVYNVSDDNPVTAAAYNDSLAEALGAPRPRRVPRFLARLIVGEALALLNTSQRVSNRRFRAATGWAPAFASVIEGWRDVVATRD